MKEVNSHKSKVQEAHFEALMLHLQRLNFELTGNIQHHEAEGSLEIMRQERDEVLGQISRVKIEMDEDTKVQRDFEREMKIIDHEIARENRLAAEATAQAVNQQVDGLLKGLQGNGEG